MIFLTVGSHEPFDRLIRAVDEWCGARGTGGQVFGQITPRAAYAPSHFGYVDVLPPDQFEARFQQADFVVSHAGMGTIITALSKGKPIVVLPRRGHLHETRNDHQYATVRHLAGRLGIHVAEDEAALPATLDALVGEGPARTGTISPYAQDSLIAALKDMIHE